MLAQADAAGAGMTAESEMFAAKASLMRHAAEMRAAAAEAHMSAAKATTAKTGVAAAAKATTVAPPPPPPPCASAAPMARVEASAAVAKIMIARFMGHSFRVDLPGHPCSPLPRGAVAEALDGKARDERRGRSDAQHSH
ncbi:hypothetical protein IVB34_27545 [Bradyrhizobium sp. 2]|uniref:hypothetical protein n=1 Tax=Bradyrhizobium sp. 2 TaxID=190045 RepID=UPI001FFAB963|nr:hypothetical protein [Bradyrhizobium sp. 2]MCK1462017.1 hypothetical protein [Bradyrhizobium sp. 2]